MAKKRVDIPAKTRDQVLKEYSHLCAICGGAGPQLHHIDEDPSDNDPMNLIPLCANHHLTDQHNPTRRIETGILRLFRQYKDPTILTPQFFPLFKRMRFLGDIEFECDADQMIKQGWHAKGSSRNLAEFVKYLEMGAYYSNQIDQLIPELEVVEAMSSDYIPELDLTGSHVPFGALRRFRNESVSDYEARVQKKREEVARNYCEKLCQVRDEIYELIMELIRYQGWNVSE